MEPKRIADCTRVLGAPSDWDADSSGPCQGLPIRDGALLDKPVMVSEWSLSDSDREILQAGGTVLLYVWGSGHPPVALDVLPKANPGYRVN